jgi:Flp pilus assembly protein TadG
MVENMRIKLAGKIPQRWLAAARRLKRRQDGAVAIEFGMVAVPFLGLLFAIIETALVFFAGQVLESAAAESARLIMTGQAQQGGLNQDSFKDAVCAKVSGMLDCKNGVYVDVRTFSSFSTVSLTNPVDANGNLIKNFVYQPGGSGAIVVVRLLYEWPVYVSLLGANGLSNLSGSKRLLISTAAFRNEPY